MRESVLNALVHLFAIVAAVNDKKISGAGLAVMENYLKRYLPPILLKKYLVLFHDYLSFYRDELQSLGPESDDSHNPLLSFQVSNVCHQIRHDLILRERMIVFVQLFRFVNEDNVISDKEDAFLHYVAEAFHIGPEDFHNVKSFIISKTDDITSDKLLKILPRKDRKNPAIIRELGNGKMEVLRLSQIHSYLFRYQGSGEVFINAKAVLAGEVYFLKEGDIINGPEFKPVYYADIIAAFFPDTREKITFSAHSVTYRFRGGAQGVQPFSFSETGGQLIGIMGGSGVGKSTLLRILSGKLKPFSGSVFLNGFNLYENKFKLKGLIGYVPQDDLLIEELTVFQNLYFNCRLSLGNFSADQARQRVEKILKELDLEEIKNLTVGNVLNKVISGGQRKRLNIGLELIREPALLFVDEPTSGLSSTDSENIIALLKKQALAGNLVVSTIHQPSSRIYRQFDKIWILDKYGYPVYAGNPIEAIEYFKKISAQVDAVGGECPVCGNLNPDQILEIIEDKKVDEKGNLTHERKISPEKWFNYYRSRIENRLKQINEQKVLPPSDFKTPGDILQFSIFFTRNFLRKLRNSQYWIINLLEAPLLAVILAFFSKYNTEAGYIFSENKNIPVFLFMSVVVALFMGLTISAEEIFRDRKILERESYLFLSRPIYLNSKILFLFLISAVQTVSFVLIANSILEIKDMSLYFWLILFSTSCFGNLLGLNISSALDSAIAIYILIPLILVPEILLGGAMIPYDNLNKNLTNQKYVPLIGDMMTTRWAYEAMAVVAFKENKYEKNIFHAEMEESNATYMTTFLIPEMRITLGSLRQTLDVDSVYAKFITDLSLIRNALYRLQKYHNAPPFELYDQLEYERVTQETLDELEGYLYFLQQTYNDVSLQAMREKDRILDSLNHITDHPVFRLKQEYHNDELSTLVLNRNQIRKIILWHGEWVQKKDPVFIQPENNLGRAQMFSAFKMINYQHFDTFVFNIIIIWSMSIMLYIVLIFNGFRSLVLLLGI